MGANSDVSQYSTSTRFVEKHLSYCFRLFAWLDDFRIKRPKVTRLVITTPLTAIITWVIHAHFTKLNSHDWIWWLSDLLFKTAAGYAVSEIFVSGAVPLLRYSWQGSSLRDIGLYMVINDPEAFCPIVAQLLTKHPHDERVRVICISGKYLFAQKKTHKDQPTPLFEWGQRGLLDVVMPAGMVSNPTVAARFKTYSDEFRNAHGFSKPEHLVREIEDCKKTLKHHNANNQIFEHHSLCLWRVVLLDKHCIVQTYFPNSNGRESSADPIFIYEKGVNPRTGYYATFDEMFRLMKDYPQSGPNPNPPTTKGKGTRGRKRD